MPKNECWSKYNALNILYVNKISSVRPYPSWEPEKLKQNIGTKTGGNLSRGVSRRDSGKLHFCEASPSAGWNQDGGARWDRVCPVKLGEKWFIFKLG